MTRVGVSLFGCDAGRSGIGRYARELLARLPGEAPGAEFDALVHASEAPGLLGEGPSVRPTLVSEMARPPLANVLWNQLALPARCRRAGYDVLFVPGGNRRLPARAPCPVVATVHDLNARHVPGKYGALRDVYTLRVLPWLIQRLDLVLTVSEFSKRDIVEVTGVDPSKVRVTPLAADRRVFHPRSKVVAQERVAAALGIEGPYLLYVSRIEHPAKNHVRLIEAFERAKQRLDLPHTLVLAGPDWPGAEVVHERAARSRVADSIHFTGFLEGGLLPWLYAGADLALVPSLAEGFGLPVLEAMACGVPVVCSDRGALPEVAGDAARIVDAGSSEAWVHALEELLADYAARQRLAVAGLDQAARFTWERTARLTWEALESVAG